MYYDVQKSAERIRKLREGRGLTQNEAAEDMGFSFGGYRKLECGLNGSSIDSLMLVAEFYHVSLDYIKIFCCKSDDKTVQYKQESMRDVKRAILTKEVFFMATSSITKNFIISGEKQVEMFADAVEASANDRAPRVPINVTYLQGADEILKFMEKKKKTNATSE